MLSELLFPESIGLPLHANTKEETIRELVRLATASRKVANEEEILKKVKEREETLSTTVGKGVFIPRARSKHISEFYLSFGITEKPLDFGALDGNPIRFCIFLGVPEGEIEDGVEYLARIFRLFNQDSFRSALLKARTKKDIIHIFGDGERDLER